LLANFGSSWAQTPLTRTTIMPPPGEVALQVGGEGLGFQFVSAEPALPAPLVKGSPYSLEAMIESAQTLSDGNRIVHRQTVHLYRDSRGRTRREETLAAIGPWAASGTPPAMVTIQDAVLGVSYFLDPQRKTASRLPSPPLGKDAMLTRAIEEGPGTVSVTNDPAAGGHGESGHVAVFGFHASSGGQLVRPEEKSESLGKESIAGISADGTRTTSTIPAEAIGNERPLDIVRERWFSNDLQIVLRSRQADPRFGETTYEVTKLDRAEPSASLFEIPSDFKVREPDSHMFIRHKTDSK
jgi:hypothetical protein